MITKTWYDPCPACGQEVTGLDYDVQTVRENPTAILSFPSPNCPHLVDEEADCTCPVLINPAPDPWYDQEVPVGAIFTFQPCKHQTCNPKDVRIYQQDVPEPWRVYQQDVPEPGSYGELVYEWAQLADELP